MLLFYREGRGMACFVMSDAEGEHVISCGCGVLARNRGEDDSDVIRLNVFNR